jgi:hypothetical protein
MAAGTLSPIIERLLIHGACSDSFHDFNTGGHFNTKMTTDKAGLYHVKYGLPYTNPDLKEYPLPRAMNTLKNSNVLHDENQIFQELFQGFPGGGAPVIITDPTTPNDTAMNDFAQYLEKLAPSKTNGMREMNFSFPNTIHGVENYTIRLLTQTHKGVAQSDIKQLYEKGAKAGKGVAAANPVCHITTDTFKNFFNSNVIQLLFDAQSIKVMKLLQYAKSGTESLTVRRIFNREVVNDPAPKTFEDPAGEMGEWAGNTIAHTVEFDAEKSSITYLKYDQSRNDPMDRDKFYSTLDFRLGPLSTGIYRKGNTPLAKMEVLQNGNFIVHSDNDPHIANRISQCWYRISKAMGGAGKKANHIEVAAHYQCKRSGDWLQALSCVDSSRLYQTYTNGAPSTPAPTRLSHQNIIIVTHDRVLLWYSIMMGIDVLFTYRSSASEKEEEDDDDDEEDEDAGDEPAGVPKRAFLIYFSNNKRSMTPDQIHDITIASAETAIKGYQTLAGKITAYNTALIEIFNETAGEIKATFDIITDKGVPADKRISTDKRNKKITEYYRAFMKLTSIDYNGADLKSLKDLGDKWVAAKNTYKTNPALKADYAKACSNYLREHSNLEQLVSSLPNKESIITSGAAYKTHELFVNTPCLYAAIREGSRNALLDEGRVAKFAAWLVENTVTKTIKNTTAVIDAPTIFIPGILLKTTNVINQVLNRTKAKSDILFFSKFLNFMQLIYKAQFPDIYETVTNDSTPFDEKDLLKLDSARLIIEETQRGLLDARAAAEGETPELPKTAGKVKLNTIKVDEYIPKDTARKPDAEDAPLIAKDIQSGVYKDPGHEADYAKRVNEDGLLTIGDDGLPVNKNPVRSMRHIAKDIFSITAPLRKYISSLFYKDLEPPSAAVNAALLRGQKGGASVDSPSLLDTSKISSYTAHLICIMYLHNLVIAIDGFDSNRNADYYYYEGLGRLVTSLLESVVIEEENIRYKKAAELLYNVIPNGSWNADSQIKINRDFELSLMFVGKQVALQSLDRIGGDLPVFNFSATVSPNVATKYMELRENVRGKNFIQRKMEVIQMLLKIQMRPGPALTKEGADSAVSSSTTTETESGSESESDGESPPSSGVVASSAASSYNKTLKNRLLAIKLNRVHSGVASTMKNIPNKNIGPTGISNNENPSSFNTRGAAAPAAGGGRKTLKRKVRKTRRV